MTGHIGPWCPMKCELCGCDLNEATMVSQGEFFVCEDCDAKSAEPPPTVAWYREAKSTDDPVDRKQ